MASKKETIIALSKIANDLISEREKQTNLSFVMSDFVRISGISRKTLENFFAAAETYYKPETIVKIFSALGKDISIVIDWSYTINDISQATEEATEEAK